MPRTITLANDSMLVAFDASGALRDLTWPHVGCENHAQGRATVLAVVRGAHGAIVGGPGTALTQAALPDALAAEATCCLPALGVNAVVTDTLLPDHPVLLRRVVISDDSGHGGSVHLRVLAGFEIAESNALNSVVYEPATRTLRFWRRNRHLMLGAVHNGVPGYDEHWCGHHLLPRDATPAHALLQPCLLAGSTASVGDVDAVAGLRMEFVAGRAEAWLWIAVGADAAAVHALNAMLLHSDPAQLFVVALRRQRTYVAAHGPQASLPAAAHGAVVPAEMPEFSAAATRSLLLARAHFDAGGSIVAAVDSATLDPGRESYAYCWPRDGAFIADTLSACGDSAAAESFFNYCAKLEKHDGAFLQRYHPDGSVASTWMATVEAGHTVVPVQADETALVLWALERHSARHPKGKLSQQVNEELLLPCTQFLLRWRGPTGLPRESVDLWEERRGIHTFTVGATIAGLRAAAKLLIACRQRALAQEAQAAADSMEAALRQTWQGHSVPPRSMRELKSDGSEVGDSDWRMDASLLGLQLLGVLRADEPMAAAIRSACSRRLQVPTWVGGHARYEHDEYLRTAEVGHEVPGNPWPLVGLLLARACAEAGESEQATTLLRGVLQRMGPCGTLAEQHHPTSGAPMGVAPLAWAHAALVDAVRALRLRL